VTLTLVDLGGAIGLLLWGLHMVQTGVQRAFGAGLRRMLGLALGNRFKSFAAGLGMTAVLQSSTATGLMVASFAAGGTIELVPALAAMLGANVGTTLLVGLLSFDVTRVASFAVLVGVMMFRRSTQTRTRDLGRVAIGLGLMLMALHQLLSLLTPYEDVPSLRMLLGMVATEPVIAVLAGALLTWAAHSSVAVVLLVISLAAKGVVPTDAAFALVLGANLGAALNPLLESAAGDAGLGKRLPLGNLFNRLVGCVLGLLLLDTSGRWLVAHVEDPARAVALFHIGFNLVLAALFFPVLGPFARLLRRLLPARVTADPSTPLYLGSAEQETPTIALAAAAREALRMTDVLDEMFRGTMTVLDGDDRRRVAETKQLDDVLDRLNSAIKSYLTALDPDGLSEADHRRLAQIIAFTTNLEHAGDVLDRNVMALAAKRLKRGIAWQPAQRAGLVAGIDLLSRNLRAAAAVLMTEDRRAARELVGSKEVFRELEAQATAAHLARLREASPVTIEASTLFLDLMRDLKRINAHVVAAAAYPVLEAEGALLPSRLRHQELAGPESP
jgi:phosphate:Na+ symporter